MITKLAFVVLIILSASFIGIKSFVLEQRRVSSLNYSPENSHLTPNNPGAPIYYYSDIYVENNLAYLYEYGHIDVYDVSKPKKAQIIDSIDCWNYPGIFSIQNNFIWSFNYTFNDQRNITGFKLLKYDFEGELQISGQSQFNTSFSEEVWSEIILKNKILFVLLTEERVNATLSEEVMTTYLLSIDITDYSNPEIIGFNELFHYESGSISYQLDFYMDSSNRLFSLFNIYYPQHSTELLVFDLTTLTDPEQVGSYILNYKYPEALAVREDTIFILYRKDGLEVRDLTDLEAFTKITDYQEKKQTFYKNLVIAGNKLYLMCSEKVRILDVADLEDIKKKGQYTPRLQGNGGFRKGIVVDDSLYVIRSSEFEDRRFFIIDCSNPNCPKKLYPSGIRLGAETLMILYPILFLLGIVFAVVTIIGGIIFAATRIKRRRRQQRQQQSKKKQEEMTEKIAEGC